MNMISWAEREVELACKKENPESKEGEFDYGCACYESALKAFKSIVEDSHSGSSILFTKEILLRLIRHDPLTEIEGVESEWDFLTRIPNKYNEYRSNRMGSLFKEVYPDGTVKYHDVNRVHCIDENGCSYYNGFISRVIHDIYPIEMPYFPGSPYVAFVEESLYDPANGDFDTLRLVKVQLPDGSIRELNKCYKEDGCTFVEIDLDEYTARKGGTEKLIDKEPDRVKEENKMDAVKNDIKELIDKELDAANAVKPPFASMHEAYSVIKEEFEEVEDEYEKAGRFLDIAWSNIKLYDIIGITNAKTCLADMYKAAMNLAVEAVQVAAMCKKAQFVGTPVEEEKKDD